jgi:methylated-DNA-[protein]-cysteine S-methyltransferase
MSDPGRLLVDRLESPIGGVLIVADAQGRLRAVEFADETDRMQRFLMQRLGQPLRSAAPARDPFGFTSALAAYFNGDIGAIAPLAVETEGTLFQRKVWRALRDIPAGRTTSYGALAARIGHPAAMRAVGAANGANAIAIVLPCHRVIGANGSLTGYGGGIERKRWLLAHEEPRSARQSQVVETGVHA